MYGDLQAHLNCVKEMLPYFHASGLMLNLPIYICNMLHLENLIDPSVCRRFIQVFFTVRRSAKFSCGTSTDVIIEQSLMKSMQTDGGISRGRSTQESVISKWVYSMHATNTVCEGLEDLANVKMDITDKHVDASDSRVKRDTEDIKKLLG
ncbi:hypothetical protein AVEN_220953-1 [Araneus ventricosus]|uniref:Uncharacterized protein n=1 Tax=Araneus ventricosus TaxID=182803 RepID=A0A4Y2HA50_ARAVE|nr:hypothetical protein AVEN_220953-1 [Araneus ventricosus]